MTQVGHLSTKLTYILEPELGTRSEYPSRVRTHYPTWVYQALVEEGEERLIWLCHKKS